MHLDSKRFARHLTFSNAIAFAALFVLLTSVGYAAKALPKNSVGSKQIKRHAVTLSKLSKGARSSLQGKVGPQGAPGPQGPRGIPGDQGATGPAGPSAVTQVSEVDGTGTWNSNFSEIPVAELQPTSGKYLLMATITLSRPTGTATDIPVTCQITNDLSGGLQIGGSGTQQVQTASDHQIFSNLTIAGAIDTQSTGEVNADFRIACKTNLVGDSTIYYVVNSFTATQVGAITTVDTNPFD